MALHAQKSDDGDSDVIPISYFAPKDRMPSHSDSEGLQVDMTNAPEVAHLYGQHKLYYNPPEYQQPEPKSESSPQQKQIHVPFGLGIWTFGLLIGVLAAVVVGAGVGGGCAAALGNCSR